MLKRGITLIKLKITNEFAILYNNIGLVNYSEGNLDKALKMYELAVQEFQKIGAENNIAVVHSNISLIYQGKNQFNLIN